MSQRKKSYEDGSLADLAAKGFAKIQKLAESSLISDKLAAINMILFLLILGLGISFFFDPSRQNIITYLLILAISLLFSCISLLFYGPLLEVILNICKNKIEGLKASINLLFIDLTVVIAGIVLNIELLVKISLTILGIQIIFIIIFSYVTIPKSHIKDQKTKPFQIWDTLGKISTIIGIITFITDIVLIIIQL